MIRSVSKEKKAKCLWTSSRRFENQSSNSTKNCFEQAPNQSKGQNFIIELADNFDLNPDGNVRNIHILNQIFVSTEDNDEIATSVQSLLQDRIIYENNYTHLLRMICSPMLCLPKLSSSIIKETDDEIRRVLPRIWNIYKTEDCRHIDWSISFS